MKVTKKFIEFVKPHDVGIEKGEIKKVPTKFAERMIDEGFAKESTEEKYEKFIKKLTGKRKGPASVYFLRKKRREEREAKIAAAEKEAAQKTKAQAKDEDKAGEKVYHKLDEVDIEANPFLTEQGFKEGDEVLLAEDGTIHLEDGKAVAKDGKVSDNK